jgi:hypothetical protein
MLPASSHKKTPGRPARGFVKSLPSAQGLTGDRPEPGPVAKKPELLTHGHDGSAWRQEGSGD